MNYTKNGQIRGSTISTVCHKMHGWQDLECGHCPLCLMFQVVSNTLVSPLLSLVLLLQWNRPFLASLPAGEQVSLLLQTTGFDKCPNCIYAVFDFLRSWKQHCKSSWNFVLCPPHVFFPKEIPLCWFFYSYQKYILTIFIGAVGVICKFYSKKFRSCLTEDGSGWDAPTSPMSCSIIGPWALIESAS